MKVLQIFTWGDNGAYESMAVHEVFNCVRVNTVIQHILQRDLSMAMQPCNTPHHNHNKKHSIVADSGSRDRTENIGRRCVLEEKNASQSLTSANRTPTARRSTTGVTTGSIPLGRTVWICI